MESKNIKRFKELGLEYKPGYIIGCAEITNCIPVTKEFEDDLISKNELVYGASRNRNGYAWELKNIQKIKPIEIKGQLGLWNYDDTEIKN